VLLCGGLATLALVAVALAVRLRALREAMQPFRWLGLNPLAIYFLSEVTGHILEETGAKTFVVWKVLEPALHWSPEAISLLYAVLSVTCWMALAGALHAQEKYVAV
jgi:predicted acyltransferase